MKVEKILTCLATLLAIVLGGYYGLDSAHSLPQKPALRVGFILPLTGALAEFGTAIQNGVQLAQEEDPRVAETFTPIFEDSRYESKMAVSAFQKLRGVDQADFSYVFGGPMSATLAPLAESLESPLFSTEYSPSLTKGRKYVFRFANTSYDFADALLENLRARGLRNFLIVKCENQYHNTLVEAFISKLNKNEHADVIASHLPGEQDFRATINKLRTARFDALGVYLLPGMQNTFLRQMQDNRIALPLFGTDTFETPSESVGVEELAKGAVYANAMVDKNFEDRYRARFANTSQIVHAALAYEFARTVTLLFSTQNSRPSTSDILRKFSNVQSRNGVLGPYSFSNDMEVGQHFKFRLSVKQAALPPPGTPLKQGLCPAQAHC